MKTYNVKLSATELKALEKIRTQKQEMTLDEAFRKAFDDYWSDVKYIRSGWRSDVGNFYSKNIAPVFGSRKLSEIKTTDIKQWLKSFSDRPTTGNRSLSVLSTIFTYSLSAGVFEGVNPCSLVKKYSEKSRGRYATEKEIATIAEILEREKAEHPEEVAFIRLLMLTGSRPSAIERLDPSKVETVVINGQRFGVYVFAGKTGEEVLIFTEAALEALNDFKPGMKMPRYFWGKIRKEAGCPDLWARDWRRTFATIGLSSGMPESILGELLNHKDPKTTKIYAKLLDTKRFSAASQICEVMADLSQSKKSL